MMKFHHCIRLKRSVILIVWVCQARMAVRLTKVCYAHAKLFLVVELTTFPTVQLIGVKL